MIRVDRITDHVHEPDDTITLDETDRRRRRVVMTSDGGTTFLLDLPEARLLRDGEGLVLDDGRTIVVRARHEALMAVRGRDARHLLSLAWQVGNRHLPAQIEETRLLLRHDHVIADMLRGLGAEVEKVEERFDPEGGAYGGHGHSHDHGGIARAHHRPDHHHHQIPLHDPEGPKDHGTDG